MILACFSYVFIKVLNIIWHYQSNLLNLTIADIKPTSSFKKITVEVICLLYILLFVYAAVSKLLDFTINWCFCRIIHMDSSIVGVINLRVADCTAIPHDWPILLH